MAIPHIMPLGFIHRRTEAGAIIMLADPEGSRNLKTETPITLWEYSPGRLAAAKVRGTVSRVEYVTATFEIMESRTYPRWPGRRTAGIILLLQSGGGPDEELAEQTEQLHAVDGGRNSSFSSHRHGRSSNTDRRLHRGLCSRPTDDPRDRLSLGAGQDRQSGPVWHGIVHCGLSHLRSRSHNQHVRGNQDRTRIGARLTTQRPPPGSRPAGAGRAMHSHYEQPPPAPVGGTARTKPKATPARNVALWFTDGGRTCRGDGRRHSGSGQQPSRRRRAPSMPRRVACE